MNRATFLAALERGLDRLDGFESRWPAFESDPTLDVSDDVVTEMIDALTERLHDNYPFFHPVFAGQMLKPPHPVAVLAYTLAMRINPNNHALDGGPATAAMELEVVADLARMVGWDRHLGHLTAGGTMANLEALWVAREEMRAGGGGRRAIAASSLAHYTHARMCQVIDVPFVPIATDDRGCLDIDDLDAKATEHEIGTVVATLGTTGFGAIEAVHDIVAWARPRGVRVHVDAAYGGFFTLIAGTHGIDVAPFAALLDADSIVVDPHKHGLQPYGCGAVLFRDPGIGRHYSHDSPYNYFSSSDLHLGEITLECSRPGAAAAALWGTTRCLPLERDRGLGPILARCRRAARALAGALLDSERFECVIDPDLDIVVYVPRTQPFTAANVTRESNRMFAAGMVDGDAALFTSKIRLDGAFVSRQVRGFVADEPEVVALRSCLMKPEHADAVTDIVAKLHRLAGGGPP